MAQDTKTKKKKKEEVKQPTAPVAPVMYMGPNVSGDVLVLQNTVFRNGFPVALQKLVDGNPELKELMVPVDNQLMAARGQLNDPGSRLARAYATAAKKMGGNQR